MDFWGSWQVLTRARTLAYVTEQGSAKTQKGANYRFLIASTGFFRAISFYDIFNLNHKTSVADVFTDHRYITLYTTIYCKTKIDLNFRAPPRTSFNFSKAQIFRIKKASRFEMLLRFIFRVFRARF